MVLLFGILERWPDWVFLAWSRLADLGWVLASLVLTEAPFSKTRVRPLVNLIVHYLEVIVIYACTYLWLQAVAGPVFVVNGCLRLLQPLESLYFSFITGATVGYGDIVPSSSSRLSSLLQPQNFIMAEVMTLLFILAISIPRYLSAPEKPPGQNG